MSTKPADPRALRRSVAAAAVLSLAAALVSQVPAGPAAAAAWSPPTPTDVKGVKVVPVAAPDRPEWTADAREITDADLPADPPDGGSATVALTAATAVKAARIRAGSLPVYVATTTGGTATSDHPSAAARAAAVPVGRVQVHVLDRAATAEQGVDGVIVQVARADGSTAAGQAAVTVDYHAFAAEYGGDWAGRLRVVDLSANKPVPSAVDPKSGTITATATLAARSAVTSLAVEAAPQGDDGDYTATSLTPASTWQVSTQTGAFTWSYPIKAPAAPGSGPAPSLALSYNSGAVDGMTSGTNTQGSWVGDGWNMWPGYIERSYRPCADDRDTKEKKNPNNADVQGGDLCWFDDNATMSADGRGGELVKVAASATDSTPDTIQYRSVNDDGSRIEWVKNAADNGDADKSYWRVTAPNGTQYYYGRDQGQGGSTADTHTDSVWTVPVYSNHPDEPGYDESFAKSRHDRAWRWNLDYVVDPAGNTMTYFYDKETGAYAREGDEDKRTTYDRAGSLIRIEYGSRTNAPATTRPAERILFDTAERCVGTGCLDSDHKPVARKYPDTPFDQYCTTAPCKTQFAPTFWTQKRLAKITTQVYAGSGDSYTDVDSWALGQTYLDAGVNEGRPMWLKSITHTGAVTSAGGSAVTDPAVVFNPTAEFMPNRVTTPNDGHSSLFRNRISTITTESGAQYGVTYSDPECDGTNLPKPATNAQACFPQYYGAAGETPKINWFHKYRVTRVDVYDNTGGFEHQQTNYDYLDKPAWAYDDSALVQPKKRTWSRFRGYGHIVVRQGIETGVQSKVEYRYFQGMDGDKQPKDASDNPPTGTPRDASVPDSLGGSVPDDPAFAGMVREQITYNGVDGDWISGVLNTPAKDGPTATSGSLTAYRTHVATTRSRTHLSTGATRWTRTDTKVNDNNLPVEVNDLGDESTAADDRCVRTNYAVNAGAGILDRVDQVETVGVNCTTTVSRPKDVLSETRTYYDDPDNLGAAPTKGFAVRTDELGSWTGSTPNFVVTGRKGYDAYGRVTSQTDALKHVTRTDYKPATTAPATQTVVTNPAGQTTTTTLDPALGVATKTVDANGAVGEMTYDGSGHVLQIWAPGRDRATTAPNASFTYQLRKNAPSYVTTKTLVPYGNSTYRTTVTLFDGLLRTRESQQQTADGGRAVTETVYDSRGLVDWTSSPYYDSANDPPDTTLVSPNGRPEIPSITQNSYDGAGRAIRSTLLGAGTEKWHTTTTYAGERTTVVPPLGGTATTSIVDARGHQVELRQYKDRTKAGQDGTGLYDKETFGYDDKDQLHTVTDGTGSTWTYDYDLRGHRISDQDPDQGTVQSGYDDGGELTSTQDGAGHALFYVYDNLGRKTEEHRGSVTGPLLAQWTYDSLVNGQGRLSSSTSYEYNADGTARAYTSAVTKYNADGTAAGTTVTVPASEGLCPSDPCSFTTGYTYNQAGPLQRVKFPAVGGLPAETQLLDYNSIGLADGLTGDINPKSQIYAQSVVYSQLDQLIGENLGEQGGHVGLTFGFDEQTGRQTSAYAIPELKTDIFNLQYGYDDAGTLTQIKDTAAGQPAETQCYRYDHQRRLTDAWTPQSQTCSADPNAAALGGPAPYWQSYSYDAAGDRITQAAHTTAGTVTRTSAYPAAGGTGSHSHAATSISDTDATGKVLKTQQLRYDGAGETLCRPVAGTADTCAADGRSGSADAQILTWNDRSELATSTDKNGATSYTYDADGNRLIRRDATGTTLYLPEGQELRETKAGAVSGTRYYSFGGATIAVRTPAGVTWYVDDHHGTAAATVSSDASLTVTRRRTDPFGNVRGTRLAWAGDKGFVGGTQDPTGLTHLGAREYDPVLGRFLSVDPLMVKDPQQWNGYAYADNSPVTMTDPQGEAADYCVTQACIDATGGTTTIQYGAVNADKAWKAQKAKDDFGQARAGAKGINDSARKYWTAASLAWLGLRTTHNYAKEAAQAQDEYLANARLERDSFISYLRDLQESGQISKAQLSKVTTVTSAWDPKTGKVYLGWKVSGEPDGWCAEDDCAMQAEEDGVSPKSLQFVETVRPRNLQQIDVCVNCQEDYDEEQVAVSGAQGAPGGRWDLQRAQNTAQAQAAAEAEAEEMELNELMDFEEE